MTWPLMLAYYDTGLPTEVLNNGNLTPPQSACCAAPHGVKVVPEPGTLALLTAAWSVCWLTLGVIESS